MEEFINKYINGDWLIFLDTCSLIEIEKYDGEFWNKILPSLIKSNKHIIVPYSCYMELEKHASGADKELSSLAKEAKKRTIELQNKDYIRMYKDDNDGLFADKVLYSEISRQCVNHKVLLITQDNGLAQDVRELQYRKSIRSKYVDVRKIDSRTVIDTFYWDTSIKKSISKSSVKNPGAFDVYKKITDIPFDEKINVESIPSSGDKVYIDDSEYVLGETIGEGGEGRVYLLNGFEDYVVKIYFSDKLTVQKYNKVKLMVDKKIEFDGICFPKFIVYNEQKQFIGYSMNKAKGKSLQKSIFGKQLLLKNFPTWKKIDTIQLCLTILNKMQFLHSLNILLGDINPNNILVVNSDEVYFVDTDSYQIEGYPCPVGTINYTAPEIQRRDFKKFLRSKGNENFAVATLLFMIMLPGKPPYSQQGGEDPSANIKRMDFSYPLGENSNKKTPEGPWRYIWSHLPYSLKSKFYQTFRKDERHSDEKHRFTVSDWINEFENYYEKIASGKLLENDPMSGDLFPTRLKKNQNSCYINCRLCGEEVDEKYTKEGICRNCLNQEESYICEKCGKKIIFNNYQKYILKKKRNKYCDACAKQENIKFTETCIDCGNSFYITNQEFDYYIVRGLTLPKRCKKCRDLKKQNVKLHDRPNSNHDYSMRKTKNVTPANYNSSCFITTVVCDYLGKEDSGYELTIFRKYRDEWLATQAGGEELIKEYYRIAPGIVEAMYNSIYFDAYCVTLWEKYLSKCLRYIENDEYEKCKQAYIDMVDYVKGIVKG